MCQAPTAVAGAAQATLCPVSQCTARPHVLSPGFKPAQTVGAPRKATRQFLEGPSSASGLKSLVSLVKLLLRLRPESGHC